MTDTKNTPEKKETNIVPVSPQTNTLVEKEMAGESEQLKQETKALVEAIKKRAQSEMKNAQTLTQDAYLNAVRNAREAIEQNKLLDPKRIEHSVEMIQRDVRENWHKTVNELILWAICKKLPEWRGIC